MKDEIWLTSNVTITRYLEMEAARDRNGLARFLDQRLLERYVTPLLTGSRNGFAMMAASCLLIETLEAFRCGWKSTQKKGRGKRAFRQFFDRYDQFADFRGVADDFYTNIRCGILHQGETTGGWRITRKRDAPILGSAPPTVHATRFLHRIRGTLQQYAQELEQADWNKIIWRNFRQKMNAVIENCQT